MLVIDVQGARQVRLRCAGTVGVFVLPAVVRRPRDSGSAGRSNDSEEAMQRRLQTARDEVAAFAEYDYVVVNDELEACVDRLAGDRARRAGAVAIARGPTPRRIVETFQS